MTSRASEQDGTSLVGFEIAGVMYAVGIGEVREILRPLSTMPLPHVPPTVVGVIDHRGDVVPIIDLRTRFGMPARSGREVRWIIVKRGERLSGLVVDRVTEVFNTGDSSAREVPAIEAGRDMRGILAAYSHHGRLIFVLDVQKLTAITETLDLEQLVLAGQEARG
jgi:purine-binding chemotaxis protein CheW